jgi:glutamate racemase
VKNTEFLLKNDCKLIVVACNTASTNAVKYLREHYEVPIIRVQPAIKPAALNSKTKVVGMLATKGTLESELLFETAQRFASGVKVVERVGEGLVDLIENGKMESPEMTQLLKKYVEPMLDHNIDQLVLGCTHYPFLTEQIREITGEGVQIIDSGEAIARQTRVILEQEGLLNEGQKEGERVFYSNKNVKVLQDMLDLFHDNLIATAIEF